MMHIKDKALWIKYAKQSLIESSIALLLFWILYAGHKVELVRSIAGDTAFSQMNSLLFASLKTTDRWDTPVVLYKVDKGYFQDAKLLDEYNNTTYGNLFPRSKIAGFIEKLDNQSPSREPLAFFIDFDMSDGSASYDNNSTANHISADDMVLLKRLAMERSYAILIPKNTPNNFIESYATNYHNAISTGLKRNISKNKIIFVGVDLLGSDTIIYRYNPMTKYNNSDQVYYNIALVGWQLRKYNGELNTTELDEIYNPDIFLDKVQVQKGGAALFRSNILYKDVVLEDEGRLKELHSNWNNLKYISALKLLKESELDISNNTIVMIGIDYQKRDIHNSTLGKMQSGAMIHAQSLKTVLFLDGKLEHFNLFLGFIIIFIVFFTVTILVRYYLNSYPEWVKFIIELITLTLILFGISMTILLLYHQWFNWFMPIVIFYIYDTVIIAREYFAKKQTQGETK